MYIKSIIQKYTKKRMGRLKTVRPLEDSRDTESDCLKREEQKGRKKGRIDQRNTQANSC